MRILREIGSELLQVFRGRSLDVLLPPILFLVLLRWFDLPIALIGSLILAMVMFARRVYQRDNLVYATGGLVGVLFASLMTYLSDNASNFFLPDIIGTSTLIVATTVSLVLKRPIAAYVSHITRGWDYAWFQREDVRPAYMEVSVLWLAFFVTRLVVEVYLYATSTVEDLVVANVILGFPLTIGVLTVSYVYGIYRLRRLGGPGVDEFQSGATPPYRGQTRGF
jgi:hypothetical protein